MTSKVFYANRMLKVKDMTPAQIAQNDGHMRNYLVHDRYLGPILIHIGFKDVDHNATIKRLFTEQMGARGEISKIQQIV